SGGRATSSRFRTPPFFRTIRFRLTVWYSSLLLIFGVAFVVALNVAIQLDDPDVPAYYEGRPMEEYVLQRRERPGEIVNTIAPVTDVYTFVDDASQRLTDDTIERIRTWSLFGIVALAIVSGLGGYVVSG